MTLLVQVVLGGPGDISPLLNGILAGLVSVTGSCAVVTSWAAFVIGGVGGLVYIGFKRLLHKASSSGQRHAGGMPAAGSTTARSVPGTHPRRPRLRALSPLCHPLNCRSASTTR